MKKLRINKGKISRDEVISCLEDKYGSLSEADCSKMKFEYEVYGLTLFQVNDIVNRRTWLVDNVVDDGYLFPTIEYEFQGYDHFAKTNAIKVIIDNLCCYLYGSV